MCCKAFLLFVVLIFSFETAQRREEEIAGGCETKIQCCVNIQYLPCLSPTWSPAAAWEEDGRELVTSADKSWYKSGVQAGEHRHLCVQCFPRLSLIIVIGMSSECRGGGGVCGAGAVSLCTQHILLRHFITQTFISPGHCSYRATVIVRSAQISRDISTNISTQAAGSLPINCFICPENLVDIWSLTLSFIYEWFWRFENCFSSLDQTVGWWEYLLVWTSYKYKMIVFH